MQAVIDESCWFWIDLQFEESLLLPRNTMVLRYHASQTRLAQSIWRLCRERTVYNNISNKHATYTRVFFGTNGIAIAASFMLHHWTRKGFLFLFFLMIPIKVEFNVYSYRTMKAMCAFKLQATHDKLALQFLVSRSSFLQPVWQGGIGNAWEECMHSHMSLARPSSIAHGKLNN